MGYLKTTDKIMFCIAKLENVATFTNLVTINIREKYHFFDFINNNNVF